MITVGLDMSLTGSGICVYENNELKELFTIKTTPKKFPIDLERLKYIVNEAMRVVPKNANMVCIEDVFTPMNKMGIGSAMKLMQLATLMRITLFDAGYPFYIISPTQLKKFLIGKGNAQKNKILMGVLKHYNIEAGDDNQADAVVLAKMAECIYNYVYNSDTEGLKAFEKEVTIKVSKERPNYNIKEKK